jgi:hypothetical protein
MAVHTPVIDDGFSFLILDPREVWLDDVSVEETVDRRHVGVRSGGSKVFLDFPGRDSRIGDASNALTWSEPTGPIDHVFDVLDEPVRLTGAWPCQNAERSVDIIQSIVRGDDLGTP